MSLEIMEKLEQKIQEMIQKSKGLEIELNRLKEENTRIAQEKESFIQSKQQEIMQQSKDLEVEINRLKEENTKIMKEKESLIQSQQQLMSEHERWKAKLSNILNKFE